MSRYGTRQQQPTKGLIITNELCVSYYIICSTRVKFNKTVNWRKNYCKNIVFICEIVGHRLPLRTGVSFTRVIFIDCTELLDITPNNINHIKLMKVPQNITMLLLCDEEYCKLYNIQVGLDPCCTRYGHFLIKCQIIFFLRP